MIFIAMCECQPLLLVLDDLQYADTVSCELLGYLVRRFSQHPLLIVGTYRDHEVSSTHPLYPIITQLRRERVLMMHRITGLTDAQIRELISNLPEALVQHIQNQAAGNPFFAEELARVCAERGMTGRHDVPSSPISPLPETITSVLEQHLRQLSDPCQRFLAYAAILGNAFTFSTIHVMMGGNSIARDEEALLTLIDEALQAHVLTEEGHGSWITYRFWHPLFIDHIYQNISSTRRAILHRKAAEALRQVYATREEEGAVLIMHHLLRSDAEASQVAHYAELAGRRAHALAAYPEAERYYHIALERGEGITTSWPQGKWLSIIGEDERREHVAHLLECLAECTRFQGKQDVARDLYQQILQMRDLPDTAAEESAVERQEKVQLQAMLWCEIGVTWYDTGDYEQALQCHQQCEQLLMEAGITMGPVWAHIRLQQSYVYWGKSVYEEAQRLALDALRLFEEEVKQQNRLRPLHVTRIRRTLAGEFIDLGRTHELLGMIANGAGQYAEALDHLETALTLHEQYNSQREIAVACCNLGDAYLRKAEHTLAETLFLRSLNVAERVGEMPLAGVNLCNLGILALRTGDLVKAEEWLKRGITLLENGSAFVHYASMSRSCLAKVLQNLDKSSEARASAYRALSLARLSRIRPCAAIALVASGGFYLARAVDMARDEERIVLPNDASMQMLKRAKKMLRHALAIGEMEVETRVEGQILLAQAMLLLSEKEDAQQLAIQTLKEAERHQLVWLVARAQSLLGSILHTLYQPVEAAQHFKRALRIFQKSGMRLEYARALHQYGSILLQHYIGGEKQYQQGLAYQREARNIFITSHAAFDLRLTE
jgi:tetratricopeptide (TPR) repeat protein